MKVLIVENEIYLAGSIATKLADIGYECEIARSVNDALKNENFDVVLLSTTLTGEDFYPVIKKFKNSIIILLIAYISNDTVSKPISAGASDYIQKPFMIEELVRKINHFVEFKKMKSNFDSYQNYITNILKEYHIPNIDIRKIKLPLILKTPKINYADNFVFSYIRLIDKPLKVIFATDYNQVQKEIISLENEYIYISGIQVLNDIECEKLFLICQKKKAIFSTTNLNTKSYFDVCELGIDSKSFKIDEIITIDEYIKYIINTYQSQFPDTELSKKLGISRKSLWEKRKKYEITKKK
ncbi:response regulator [Campylobacter pinnipediorum]|uniref:response regulator n=1 Tax=Campylobacter pinnipediorum TaxID=1965231 RepID=UPI00084DE43A|nr:response regulator [Campylobacter pinnipediorum]